MSEIAEMKKPAKIMEEAIAAVELKIEEPKLPKAEKKPKGKKPKGKKPDTTQTSILIHLAESVELYNEKGGIDSETYVSFENLGHRETWAVKSTGFRRWLRKQYYDAYKTSPSSQPFSDAVKTIETKAAFDGEPKTFFTRVGEDAGNIYIDLANEKWEVVEIKADGWKVIPSSKSPVKFCRRKGTKEIPKPLKGGKLENLREFLNFPEGTHENEWKLFVAFVLGCFNPGGPYPILTVSGEQGSAKSFACEVLKRMVDPYKAAKRTLPRDERDFAIQAQNNWLLAADNVSHLTPWQSDFLCSISTGGGFSTRALYNDDEEKLFEFKRPVVLNGIGGLVTRADLLDRSINIVLPVIEESARKSEEKLLRDFEEALPKIWGGLCDVLVSALKNKVTELDSLPRMADFALFVASAENGLGWEKGSFIKAYSGNRDDANSMAIESSVIGSAILKRFEENEPEFDGYLMDFMKELGDQVGEKVVESKSWPTNARSFSTKLTRIAPNLRKVGIDITSGGKDKNGRKVIVKDRRVGNFASPSSFASLNNSKPVDSEWNMYNIPD